MINFIDLLPSGPDFWLTGFWLGLIRQLPLIMSTMTGGSGRSGQDDGSRRGGGRGGRQAREMPQCRVARLCHALTTLLLDNDAKRNAPDQSTTSRANRASGTGKKFTSATVSSANKVQHTPQTQLALRPASVPEQSGEPGQPEQPPQSADMVRQNTGFRFPPRDTFPNPPRGEGQQFPTHPAPIDQVLMQYMTAVGVTIPTGPDAGERFLAAAEEWNSHRWEVFEQALTVAAARQGNPPQAAQPNGVVQQQQPETEQEQLGTHQGQLPEAGQQQQSHELQQAQPSEVAQQQQRGTQQGQLPRAVQP